MRLAPILVLLALMVAPAAASSHQSKTFVGTTTRELLTGPLVLCDVNGMDIGGACFEKPANASRITVVAHVDNVPEWMNVPLMIYAYNDADPVPIAVDGDVECPVNHGAVAFHIPSRVTRIVVAVGPWAMVARTCEGVPGTGGTIEMFT